MKGGIKNWRGTVGYLTGALALFAVTRASADVALGLLAGGFIGAVLFDALSVGR